MNMHEEYDKCTCAAAEREGLDHAYSCNINQWLRFAEALDAASTMGGGLDTGEGGKEAHKHGAKTEQEQLEEEVVAGGTDTPPLLPEGDPLLWDAEDEHALDELLDTLDPTVAAAFDLAIFARRKLYDEPSALAKKRAEETEAEAEALLAAMPNDGVATVVVSESLIVTEPKSEAPTCTCSATEGQYHFVTCPANPNHKYSTSGYSSSKKQWLRYPDKKQDQDLVVHAVPTKEQDGKSVVDQELVDKAAEAGEFCWVKPTCDCESEKFGGKCDAKCVTQHAWVIWAKANYKHEPAPEEECNCYKRNNPSSKYHSMTCKCAHDFNPFKPTSEYAGGSYGGSYTSTYVSCKKEHDREAKPFELNKELGLSIYLLAYRDVKFVDSEKIDVGVYLYDAWQAKRMVVTPGLAEFAPPPGMEPLTEAVMLGWPDMNAYPSTEHLVEVVRWMLDSMAEHGWVMETGCMGGHGRTGTMAACLLIGADPSVTPGQAIKRVRDQHCEKAVESSAQVDQVREFYKLWHGHEKWRSSSTERELFQGFTGSKSGKVTTGFQGSGSSTKAQKKAAKKAAKQGKSGSTGLAVVTKGGE